MFTKTKKPLSVILSLLMLLPLFGCLTLTAAAETFAQGDVIEYGSYPQTKVTDETLLAALASVEKNWVSYGYYAGIDGVLQPGDFMKFADFFYGGNKYRAVMINNYRPRIVTQNLGSDPVQPSNGYPIGIYYFLYEPLRWRVLDAGTGFVMCEDLVDNQPFQSSVYVKNNVYRQGEGSSDPYANAYATSNIRDWLNNEFWNTAFTDAQKSNVKTTHVDNTVFEGINGDKYRSPDTDDKIFLLSLQDIKNTAYGFQITNSRTADPTKAAVGTDYAYSQGLNGPGAHATYVNSYWLRTPIDRQYDISRPTLSVYRVYDTGTFYNDSFATDCYTGVRPACCLNVLRNDVTVSPDAYSGLHTAVFSAEGNALTGTCSNEDCCLENNALSLILTAPEKTAYGDGKNAEATLANLESFNFEFGLALSADGIAYYQGETLLETAPTLPGSYTAVYTATVGDGIYTLSVDYVISNGTPAVDPLPGYTAVYGDMLSSVALPDGWSWNTPDVRVGNVGDNVFTATYSTGDVYYNTVSQDVTVTVSARPLTVTADAKSKTYGEADPELTYTVEALVEGDALEGALTRTGDDNVGVYAITQGTLSAGDNYTISYTGASFTVGARVLTVTADAKSKTYGEADPELTYTVEGLVEGDALTGALARTGNDNAGVYAITQGTLTAGDNYAISFTGASFTIGKKTLTITADAKSKTYGEADPELTYTVEGELVGGDTLTGALTRTGDNNVGVYEITLGTLTAGDNYDLTFTGADFIIEKKALTVTADAGSKTYGEADPELTYTAEGLAEGDTLSGALARTGDNNVGVYEITLGTLTAGDNYDLTFTGADFIIEKKALTVTADAKNKTYGEADPALTYKAEGLVAGDSLTGKLARASGSNVGTYAITQGTLTAGDNYDLTFTGADFTVTKRALTVTADAKSKEQGAEDPALTYSVTGLQYNDTVTVTLSRAPGEEPGSYAITAVINAGDNYEVTYAGATLTVRAPQEYGECPYCGEIHNERTFVGFFTRFIHLLLFIIKRINFHMF